MLMSLFLWTIVIKQCISVGICGLLCVNDEFITLLHNTVQTPGIFRLTITHYFTMYNFSLINQCDIVSNPCCLFNTITLALSILAIHAFHHFLLTHFIVHWFKENSNTNFSKKLSPCFIISHSLHLPSHSLSLVSDFFCSVFAPLNPQSGHLDFTLHPFLRCIQIKWYIMPSYWNTFISSDPEMIHNVPILIHMHTRWHSTRVNYISRYIVLYTIHTSNCTVATTWTTSYKWYCKTTEKKNLLTDMSKWMNSLKGPPLSVLSLCQSYKRNRWPVPFVSELRIFRACFITFLGGFVKQVSLCECHNNLIWWSVSNWNMIAIYVYYCAYVILEHKELLASSWPCSQDVQNEWMNIFFFVGLFL